MIYRSSSNEPPAQQRLADDAAGAASNLGVFYHAVVCRRAPRSINAASGAPEGWRWAAKPISVFMLYLGCCVYLGIRIKQASRKRGSIMIKVTIIPNPAYLPRNSIHIREFDFMGMSQQSPDGNFTVGWKCKIHEVDEENNTRSEKIR
jgi:hypothetical protein